MARRDGTATNDDKQAKNGGGRRSKRERTANPSGVPKRRAKPSVDDKKKPAAKAERQPGKPRRHDPTELMTPTGQSGIVEALTGLYRTTKDRRFSSELLGIALLAFGGLLTLGLISFSPNDPSFTTTGTGRVQNLVGPFGAFFSDLLFLVFGLFAHGVPALLLFSGYRALQKRRLMMKRTVVGGIVALIGATAFLDVIVGRDPALHFAPGGLIGVVLGRVLTPILHPLGAALVSFVVAVVGITVVIERPISQFVRDGARVVRDIVDELLDRIDAWRLERRLVAEEAFRLHAELDEGTKPVRRGRLSLPPERAMQIEARPMLVEDGSQIVIRPVRVNPAQANPDNPFVLKGESAASLLDVNARRAKGIDPRWTRVALDGIAQHEEDHAQIPDAAFAAPDLNVEGEFDAEFDGDQSSSGRIPIVVMPPPPPVDDDADIAPDFDDVSGDDLAARTTKKKRRRGAPVEAVSTRDSGLHASDDDDDVGERLVELGDDEVVRPTDAGTMGATSEKRVSPRIVSVDDAATEPGISDEFKIVDREDAVVDLDDNDIVPIVKTTWELPPLKFLDYDAPERVPLDEAKMQAEAEKLVRKFRDFGIDGRVREVRPGPVVTTYEFVPAPGIKVSRIAALSDDIAMAMEAVHVRIVAPIPGKGAVGIEIPNERRETVFLKEIIAHEKFKTPDLSPLTMALGKDIEGKPYFADLAAMPHVLIAGTTGSGKSVSVNAMICSLLYRCTPDELKFIMIDPKMLELSLYDGIPHLLLPPITDSKKAANALQWAVGEMERRYKAMSEAGVRDLKGFNDAITDIRAGTDPQKRKCPLDVTGKPYGKIPHLVIVVDEYADLLAVAGKEVEGFVMRLAQKARAAGIHVMLATQRPSVDVITGVIKANFPVRMGFRLASNHDSKTIINRPGAEKLLGRGDMLIMPPGTSNVTRVHGAFISEKELHRVVAFLKGQTPNPGYDMSIMETPPSEDGDMGDGAAMEKDAKYDDAVDVVRRSRKCSTSWLQRQLGIGYNRAARIVEMMERLGVVGPSLNAKGDREIFVAPVAPADA